MGSHTHYIFKDQTERHNELEYEDKLKKVKKNSTHNLPFFVFVFFLSTERPETCPHFLYITRTDHKRKTEGEWQKILAGKKKNRCLHLLHLGIHSSSSFTAHPPLPSAASFSLLRVSKTVSQPYHSSTFHHRQPFHHLYPPLAQSLCLSPRHHHNHLLFFLHLLL